MNKKLFHIILMILFIFFLTGCWGAPQAKPQLKPKGKIGFLVAETKSARNQYLMTQMKKEATHQKLKLFTGDSKLDPKIQETQIEKMIKEKVQVLIFQPLNVEETKEQINRLLEKNIKIILLDFLPLDVTVDAFIAPDYLRAGELQAQFVVGQGKQVTPYVLKGDPLNYLSDKILQGNKNILQNNSLVDIFIIREITNKYEQQSYQSLKNEFDQISPNVLISHYEEITMGVIKFLKEIAKEQQLMVLSLDINQELLPELAKGNLTIVDTMPNLLVTVILETADSLLNNKTWNYDLQINNGSALIPTKYTPVRVINKDNIELLTERFTEQVKKEEAKGKKEKQDTQKDQNNPNQNTKQKQTIIKFTTKDGQEYEMTIPGEIEKIELEPKEEQSSS